MGFLAVVGLVLTGSSVLSAVRVQQTPADVQDPDEEEAAYERLLAERTLADNCQMCHTIEMVNRLRLTPAQWNAEVDKMVGWGAPVPPEDRDRLVAFLAAEYPVEKPRETPGRLSSEELQKQNRVVKPKNLAGDPESGAKLYATHCASCHGDQARGGDLGTNLVEKPVLVDPKAYAEVVRNGRRRMPAFKDVLNPDQEADTLAWLRQKRFTIP